MIGFSRFGRSRTMFALVAVSLFAVAACTTGGGGGGGPVGPVGAVGASSRLSAHAGMSGTSAMSADGQFVAYVGDVTGDDPLPTVGDLYRWNRSTGVTTKLTSTAISVPRGLHISEHGRYVTFVTDDDLGGVPPATPSPYVYSYDADTAIFTFVSGEGNGDGDLAVSSDGGHIYFAQESGGTTTVQHWERFTGTSATVMTGSGYILPMATSDTGYYTALYVAATGVPGASTEGLYRQDLLGGLTKVVDPPGGNANIFPNNAAVTFAGDVIFSVMTNDPLDDKIITSLVINQWTQNTGTTSTVVDEPGRVTGMTGASRDGRFVSYLSFTSPLDTTPFDGTDAQFPAGEIRLLDRQSSITSTVATGHVGVGDLLAQSVSDDGRTVVYASNDSLPGPDNNNGWLDLFFWAQTN